MLVLYAADASGPSLLVLDDAGRTTDDGGAPFVPEFTVTPFDQGPAGGWGTFRRFTQAVAVGGGAAGVTVTPLVDGSELTGQETPYALDPEGGAEQQLDVPVFAAGTRYGVRVKVTSHQGPVAFGESDQWVVPRRTIR